MSGCVSDFEERAAILEFDHGMTRADAETQALREILDQGMATKPAGILGELMRAARHRSHPDLAAPLEALRLHDVRVPMWGVDWVVPDGTVYRLATNAELGRSAVIVPAVEEGCVVDLVAQGLHSGGILPRLGVAPVVGADEIEVARSTKRPLYVFPNLLAWLRGSTRGAVILDWPHVGRELEGVETIICSESIAARLHAGTRKCFPVPAIATPSVSENHLCRMK